MVGVDEGHIMLRLTIRKQDSEYRIQCKVGFSPYLPAVRHRTWGGVEKQKLWGIEVQSPEEYDLQRHWFRQKTHFS